MIIGVDASTLTKEKTGVGNYVYRHLVKIVEDNPLNTYHLYSNSDIEFPNYVNVKKHVIGRGAKGPFWVYMYLSIALIRMQVDYFWATNGVAPFGKFKLIVTIHDFVYKYASSTMLWHRRMSRWIMQTDAILRANIIVCVSTTTANDLNSIFGKKVDYVVYPLVSSDYKLYDTHKTNPTLSKYGVSGDFIVAVGTIEPRKNYPSMLKHYSVAYSKAKIPKLVIIGGHGWGEIDLKEKYQKLVENNSLLFLDYVESDEHVAHIMNRAKYLISYSIYEGYGMPVAEALCCGCPVILSDIPVYREITNNRAIYVSLESEELSELFCNKSINQDTVYSKDALKKSMLMSEVVSLLV